MKIPVRKHLRRMHGKRVRISKHNRNVRARINKQKRKLFTTFAQQPYEIGGPLDFQKGGELENAKLHFGSSEQVEYEWDPDYEISFHTHPHKYSIMPSYDDLQAMRDGQEKEQVIFNKKIAISIYEKDKFNKVTEPTLTKIDKELNRDYRNGMSDKELFAKYQPIFKDKLGLKMQWHHPGKEIKLESKVV